jgi:hypothetical protein
MKTVITARRVAVPGIVSFLILIFLSTYSSRIHRPVFLDGQGTLGGESHDESPKPEDKILVMAKIETENTDWVMENLPEYGPICSLSHIPQLKHCQAGNMRYITWTTRNPNSMSQRTRAVKAWRT